MVGLKVDHIADGVKLEDFLVMPGGVERLVLSVEVIGMGDLSTVNEFFLEQVACKIVIEIVVGVEGFSR